MKIKSTVLLACFGAVIFIPALRAGGRDPVTIRRVRYVANPAPGAVPGDQVLEVTFTLDTPTWAKGMGWCLRYYGDKKNLLGEAREAYIDPSRNPMSRIHQRSFKGQTVFTLLFPLREGAEHLVLALGNGLQTEVILYPYTSRLEEFNIPLEELNDAIARSRLIVLGD